MLELRTNHFINDSNNLNIGIDYQGNNKLPCGHGASLNVLHISLICFLFTHIFQNTQFLGIPYMFQNTFLPAYNNNNNDDDE